MIKINKLNNDTKSSIKLRTITGLIIALYGLIIMIAIGFTDPTTTGWCHFITKNSTRHIVSCVMQLVTIGLLSWTLILIAKELLFCFTNLNNKKYIAILSTGLILTQLLPTLCWIMFPFIYSSSSSSFENNRIILFLVLIIILMPFVIFFIFLPFYIHISKMKNGSKNTLFNRILFPLLCLIIPITFCFIYYLAIARTWTTIFILIAIVVSCDTFAYFVGIFLGRHKMAPIISPKKTWEGAIGGIILSVLFILFLFWVSQYIPQNGPNRHIASNFFGCQWYGGQNWTTNSSSHPNMWSWQWWLSIVIILIILSIAVVVGDLIFSYFKRKNNIKDFSNFIKGHGGILDRMDSFIFVILFFGTFTFIISLASFYIHSKWGSVPLPDQYINFLFPNWNWYK